MGVGPREGDFAPAFALPEAPGREVDVGALIGREKLVLLFFPLAFSRVCTAEMRGVADRIDELERHGARVFAISVDSPFVTRKFREEEDLPFPVLSDFNRAAATRYDVLYDEFYGLEGVAKRSVFVVDSEGRIVYRWVSDDADVEPDVRVVAAAVRDAV